MNEKPLVSVIIPTYKRPQYLEDVILSVKAQTYPNLEIIVVDDNSWEETSSVAEKFNDVKFLTNEKNSGCGYSRGRGLRESRGQYIVFIDDDDYFIDSTFFERSVAIMEENKEIISIFAGVKVLNVLNGTETDQPFIDEIVAADEYLKEFGLGRKVPYEFAAIYSRENLIKCGIDKMEMLNHNPLFMRSMISGGKICCIKDMIGVYRVHGEQLTNATSAAFLLKNLEEKYAVYKLIKEKAIDFDVNQWWKRQIVITLDYFIYGTHPSAKEFNIVKKWCYKNFNNNNEIKLLMKDYKISLRKYRKNKLKEKIKKILRMK